MVSGESVSRLLTVVFMSLREKPAALGHCRRPVKLSPELLDSEEASPGRRLPGRLLALGGRGGRP